MFTDIFLFTQVAMQPIAALDTFMPSLAPAYLDPGTGSLIIQVAIGALVGGLFAARVFWKRTAIFVKNIFTGGSKREDSS